MPMAPYELLPLSLGELLDRTFTLYRRNFALFAGIMLLPICVNIPVQFAMLRIQGAPFRFGQPSAPPRAMLYIFALSPVLWLVYAVAHAAITYAVSDTYLGRPSTIVEAYRKTRGQIWRVIGVSLGVGIRVGGFLALLAVLLIAIPVAAVMPSAIAARGGAAPNTAALAILFLALLVLAPAAIVLVLWFSVRYSVSIPAVVLENIKGSAAIRRSVDLSKGRRWQGLLALLLGVVIAYAMVALFQGPFYAVMLVLGIKGQLPVWLSLCMAASSSIASMVAGPIPMIVFVLFYYDLRIRKEAFDLQQMMASLPEPGSAPPSQAPA
jgi:hypothetical protein